MTAWEWLKSRSSLLAGSAWDLLTHPAAGSGVVINDGYFVEMTTMEVETTLLDTPVLVEVPDQSLTVEIPSTGAIEVEIAE